jgi:hypothetical protein
MNPDESSGGAVTIRGERWSLDSLDTLIRFGDFDDRQGGIAKGDQTRRGRLAKALFGLLGGAGIDPATGAEFTRDNEPELCE